VKPSNIRNTHFSRNPKIAAFLKAYHYVKEFGEGMDRICREQEANGAQAPSFRTDDFILKITIPKVTENVTGNKVNRIEKLPENGTKLPERLPEGESKLTEKLEKLLERAKSKGDRLTENRITMLRLMIEDPYVSKSTLAEVIGISYTAVGNNIKAMRGKYLRRVGPDKGGFWEIIEE
jgi:ATP-dependent DNA helicase RecG